MDPYSLPAEDRERIFSMRFDHCDDTHNAPYGDPKLGGIAYDEVCGLDSRESLAEWFEGWTHQLAMSGFEIHVYEVPDEQARVGADGQTVFRAAKAVLIGTESLTEA
ncbi:hypothetical protein AB0958_21945 [Streptomyces sp. NPDC006655]|uniref:hypothetical protein n=1 Tax=Streptomyces sp. NPDC006655 TaxID=3156898 RepID=UPI003451C842